MNIALQTIHAKFPIEQIQTIVREHILPLICLLPDKRLGRIAKRIILGILGGQMPVITEIACQRFFESFPDSCPQGAFLIIQLPAGKA